MIDDTTTASTATEPASVQEQHQMKPETDQARWRSPPSDDALLKWRFCDAEAACGFRATDPSAGGGRHGAFDDGRSRVARAVGEMNSASSAARVRRIDGALNQLSARQREVLWWAYGPMMSRWTPQHEARLGHWPGVVLVSARAQELYAAHLAKSAGRVERIVAERQRDRDDRHTRKAELEVDLRSDDADRRDRAASRLAEHRMHEPDMLVTPLGLRPIASALAASSETQAALSLRFSWLRHEASKEQIADIRSKAGEELWISWNMWADLRGRRQRVERRSPTELAAFLDGGE